MSDGSWRRFVASFFAAFGMMLAAIGAINVAVDPTGLWGNNLVFDHPTDLEEKSALLHRTRPFHTLILGSSRAYRLDPERVQALTGRSAFNGAIAGGTVALYSRVFARAINTHGRNVRSVMFLLDEDKFRAAPAGVPVRERLQQTFAFATLRASARFVQSHIFSADPSPYRSDGFQRTDRAVRTAKDTAPGGAAKGKDATPASWGGYHNPTQRRAFEAFLRAANSHGIRPVIVLTPVHPDVFSSAPKTWHLAHNAFVSYVFGLQQRFSLVAIDATDVSSFGGTTDGFLDAAHMDTDESEKLLKMVVKRAGRAF